MALANIEDYLKLIPMVKKAPHGYLWSSYDAEAVIPVSGSVTSGSEENEGALMGLILLGKEDPRYPPTLKAHLGAQAPEALSVLVISTFFKIKNGRF